MEKVLLICETHISTLRGRIVYVKIILENFPNCYFLDVWQLV